MIDQQSDIGDLDEEPEDAGDDNDVGTESGTDNVGDASVEINVEALIRELEAQGGGSTVGRKFDAKRRLEELMELKRAHRDLEDFEDYEI